MTSEATGRAHLPASILVSDRSRIDLRWINGEFRWRYRNRLKLERTFRLKRFDFTPYAHAEVSYSLDQSHWRRLLKGRNGPLPGGLFWKAAFSARTTRE